ncbi:MAG TPA: N(4)-(beta-N-acetylglucosaminyl)-L-asparaginase [Chitinophagaceae bacterium]|nr:N(4)-(beta-N-acetylglucosaminyl)-L-asparaginase [Chitinophagaceae bacterium]
MIHRRKFLQLTSLTAPLLSAKDAFSFSGTSAIKPIVVSTWDFGKAANAEAWKVLVNGGKVVDAVEAGVKVPEADESNQSVGYGGLPDRDGRVTLDACIMDGANLACGSVACLEHIVHPISVAKLVMEKTPHVMLVGDGALQFAIANGFTKTNLLTPKSERDWKEWLKKAEYKPVINIEKQLTGDKNNHDTIGMIAIDATGNIGGACTTSGLAYKLHGRVGDSPIIGAGLYADSEVGAATSSGMGEEVIRTCGSHTVVELMRQGYSPEKACKKTVERIIKRNPERAKTLQVGFLAINKKGEFGAYAIHKGFNYAVKSNSEEKIYDAKFTLNP